MIGKMALGQVFTGAVPFPSAVILPVLYTQLSSHIADLKLHSEL
jgi:hypothetical protein